MVAIPRQADPTQGEHARWLNARARPVAGWLALSAVGGLVSGLAIIAQAGLIAMIVSAAVIDGTGLLALTTAFGALAGAILARAVGDWTRLAAGDAAGKRVCRRLRMDLVDHIAAIGPVRLSGDHSAALANQALEQVDAVDGYFSRFLPQLVLAVLLPVVMLGVAFSLDWVAGLILLAALPLIPTFMALVGAGAEDRNRRQLDAMERLSGHFLDRVRGLATLRLFGRGDDAVTEVARTADAYRKRSMSPLRLAFLSSAVLEFFASVALAAAAIYIGFSLLGYFSFGPASEMTLFAGLFLLLLAPELYQPLRLLAQHYHDRAGALAAAASVAATLARPAQAVPVPRQARRNMRAAAVTLESVTAGHPGRGRVIEEANLQIKPGERIALVGPSGAGKSTLLQVMAGFIAPESGRVTVDGEPPGVPGRAAWIGQRPFLQHGTIADNILLGRPWASRIELEEAARRAGVLEFASQRPAGLDSAIGERGRGLSGGQAQRVAIARALLADTPLLLLDEPTAHLDAAAERRVLEALKRLASTGRTLVIATHHPAVRTMAHRVVIVREGHTVDASARA
ncbi:MAG: thiol reductant ABC exporter subunit CydD [Halofilum sp. (in: g-proteobacteria)]